MSDDVKYEVVERLGVISTSSKDWTTELRLVSWNGRDAKYDIRSWSPDGTKMGKGITLTTEELKHLGALINELQLD